MSIEQEVDQQQERDPAAVIERHRGALVGVLPRQLQPAEAAAGWLSAVTTALRSDRKLWDAAQADVGAFMGALQEAARLGHVPGTPAYYLTIRSGRIKGIEGYRGVIDRMYRTGMVAAVVADVVRETDEFDIDQDARRVHHRPAEGVSWFAEQQRGRVIGAYAWADMTAGGRSKIEHAGDERIARARAASAASSKGSGPWVTDYAAMVLKTVLHDLERVVPTSVIDRRTDAAEIALAQLAQPIQLIDAPAIEAAPVSDVA